MIFIVAYRHFEGEAYARARGSRARDRRILASANAVRGVAIRPGDEVVYLARWQRRGDARQMRESLNVAFLAGVRPLPGSPCRQCSGPIRQTVGMVCQACGTDYGL